MLPSLALIMRMCRAFFAALWERLRRGPRRPGWSFLFEVAVALLRSTAHATAARPVLEQRAAGNAFPPSRPPRGQTRETHFVLAGLPAIRMEPLCLAYTPPASDAFAEIGRFIRPAAGG